MSILISPDLILCIILVEEQDKARKTMTSNTTLFSEHIGKRYHYIIRKHEELPAGIGCQPTYRT